MKKDRLLSVAFFVMLAVLISLFLGDLGGFRTPVPQRSTEVQIEERRDGYVIYMYSDPDHWDEDGKKVDEVALAKAQEIWEGFGRKPTGIDTNVRNEEKRIYIRRMRLFYD